MDDIKKNLEKLNDKVDDQQKFIHTSIENLKSEIKVLDSKIVNLEKIDIDCVLNTSHLTEKITELSAKVRTIKRELDSTSKFKTQLEALDVKDKIKISSEFRLKTADTLEGIKKELETMRTSIEKNNSFRTKVETIFEHSKHTLKTIFKTIAIITGVVSAIGTAVAIYQQIIK